MEKNYISDTSLLIKISQLRPFYLNFKGLKTYFLKKKSDSINFSRIIRKNLVPLLQEAEIDIPSFPNQNELSLFYYRIYDIKNIKSLIIKDNSLIPEALNDKRALTSKYKFHNLKTLSVTKSSHLLEILDFLLKLKTKVHKFALEKLELNLTVYSYVDRQEIKDTFYQTFRIFHSITDLNLIFKFMFQKEDSIALAKTLNLLKNLRKFSINFSTRGILSYKIAFLQTLTKSDPKVYFEFYTNEAINSYPDFEKYLNAMSSVNKLYLKFSYTGEYRYEDILENKSIEDVTWEFASTSYENYRVIDVLKINKKLTRLKSFRLSLNKCANLSFIGFDILPNGENHLTNFELSLKNTKISWLGLVNISEQISKLSKLKSLSLAYSDKPDEKEGLKRLFDSIKSLSNLRKLIIDADLQNNLFYEFAKEESNLKSIDITLISQLDNINNLTSSLLKLNLRSLNLRIGHQKIDKTHLIELFKAVSTQKNLFKLELNFSSCSTLTPAILNDFFSNLSYKNFASLIFTFHQVNTFKVNASRIFERLSENSSLRVLKLDLQLYILENGLKGLIKLLSNQSCLEILSLTIVDHFKTISPEDIIDFSRILKTFEMMIYLQLTFLKMYHINQDKIHCIFESISELPRLETIEMMIIIDKNNPNIYSSVIKDLLKRHASIVTLNNREI